MGEYIFAGFMAIGIVVFVKRPEKIKLGHYLKFQWLALFFELVMLSQIPIPNEHE